MRFFEQYTNYALLYTGNGNYNVRLVEYRDGYCVWHRFNIGHDNRPHSAIFGDIRTAIELALTMPRVYTSKAISMAADILGYDYKSIVMGVRAKR